MTIDYSNYYWQNELVHLRQSTPEDWEQGFPGMFDSPARFFLDSEQELPPDREICKENWENFVASSRKNGRPLFAIENNDGTLIGGANIKVFDQRNGIFGIGMCIHREHRGQGFGTAAMKLLLDYAFNELRLHKFQSFVIDGNIPSETMLKKLGCVKEGVIRGTTYHQGRYWDEIHYGLFAEEFCAQAK